MFMVTVAVVAVAEWQRPEGAGVVLAVAAAAEAATAAAAFPATSAAGFSRRADREKKASAVVVPPRRPPGPRRHRYCRQPPHSGQVPAIVRLDCPCAVRLQLAVVLQSQDY